MAARAAVNATRVDDAIASETPGAYQFVTDAIICSCPCGCGSTMRLPVYTGGQPKVQTPSWSWNGYEQKPSLNPSIRDLGSCYFHGHLTDGVWTFCSDSGIPQKAKS